jgi:hypothetical protein
VLAMCWPARPPVGNYAAVRRVVRQLPPHRLWGASAAFAVSRDRLATALM